MAEDKLYEVEQILGKKMKNNRLLYLVRWRGFSSEHDSWEPYSNLTACKTLIQLFNKDLKCKTNITLENASVSQDIKNTNSEYTLQEDKEVIIKKQKKSQIVDKNNKINTEILIGKNNKDLHLEDKVKGDKPLSINISDAVINVHKPEILKKTMKRKLNDGTSKTLINDVSKAKKPKLLNEDHSDSLTGSLKENDEENDDDILYSLNLDCNVLKIDNEKNKLTFKKQVVKEKQNATKSKSSVIAKKPTKLNQSEVEKLKKIGTKKKSSSLINSKKKSKDWLSKSGLLRSVSPPPFFTSVKNIADGRDRNDTASISGNSLPNLVSPDTSETYLADVPSTFLVTAEEPIITEQTMSSGSLFYKSILDSLPEQLHPSHKNDTKFISETGSDDCGTSNNGGSLISSSLSSTFGKESVERRTSVRSTECAFRYKQIVVKKCLHYTQIWLNTHTVMQNALNPQVIQEVVSALNSAKYDDSHLVLFSSLGNVFCSGTDLHFLVSGDRKMAARQMTDAIRELTKTFITFPKPIIAAVSGAVVGLGVALLALCDIVYASDKASFHMPYLQLSQTTEGCSSYTIPLTVGLPAANELLFGGKKITAMEACQLGLVSQVFWPTLMMQEVIPRAQKMANGSAKALEATKLLVRSHHRTKMELTNETECNLLLERWTTSDCQRAIEAYISNEKNFTF